MSVHQEIEAKFCVRHLDALQSRLETQGALCMVPRRHEYNLRFDTPDGQLSRRHQVLRLRRGDDVRLTYKEPLHADAGGEVSARREMETVVQDFETMRAILLALGYEIYWIYEKYRAIYRLDEDIITLDETPLGFFVEIEAASPSAVLKRAAALGLDASAGSALSYRALFQRAAAQMQPPPPHLTFAAFDEYPPPSALGLRYAD